MQNPRFSVTTPSSRARQFKVVVAFDGADSSSPALRTCEYVISQLGEDISVRRKIIDLNQDLAPRSRAAAARDAANADMVIVSTRDDEQLSAPMQQWLDQWTPQRAGDEGALVAILNHRTEDRRLDVGVRARLEDVARAAHMDFFSSEVLAV